MLGKPEGRRRLTTGGRVPGSTGAPRKCHFTRTQMSMRPAGLTADGRMWDAMPDAAGSIHQSHHWFQIAIPPLPDDLPPIFLDRKPAAHRSKLLFGVKITLPPAALRRDGDEARFAMIDLSLRRYLPGSVQVRNR